MITIGIIATLDTKYTEATFMKEVLEAKGASVIMIDSSLRISSVMCNITQTQILDAAGSSVDELEHADKSSKIQLVTTGLTKITTDLYGSGTIQGILSIGGAQGSAISTTVMKSLPLGFPKVMISTIACSNNKFGDYVGNKDIVCIPSIADICGINTITKKILINGCGAILGMASLFQKVENNAFLPTVAITMAGVTTPCVMYIKNSLEKLGYEPVIFHTNGVGFSVIEEMAVNGELAGIIDLTPHEISGHIFHGIVSSPGSRLSCAYALPIPIVTVPGGLDFVVKTPNTKIAEHISYLHTPYHLHVRLSPEEFYQAGAYLASQLSINPVHKAILFPEKGVSMLNKPGELFYEDCFNQSCIQGILDHLDVDIPFSILDLHINDFAFAQAVVNQFLELQTNTSIEKEDN